MKKVQTVLGSISPEELGFTSMHEHILANVGYYGEYAKIASPKPDKNRFPCDSGETLKMEYLSFLRNGYYSHLSDNLILDDVKLMESELNDYKFTGGSSILELSVPGIRGNIEDLKLLSQETGIHIIASTGLYAEETWPVEFKEYTVAKFQGYLMNEIKNGIDDSNILPGHIKFAPNTLSEREKKMLKAVARTVRETNYSATIHHGILLKRNNGMEMAKILLEEGVNPNRIVLAHVDKLCFVEGSYDLRNYILNPNKRELDLEYAERLLDMGFNLSFDTFGHNWHLETRNWLNQNDYERMAALVALINKGYSKQLVIGCDVYTKFLTRRYGGDGYSRLLNFVVPTLEELDIKEIEIKNITENNAVRILSV